MDAIVVRAANHRAAGPYEVQVSKACFLDALPLRTRARRCHPIRINCEKPPQRRLLCLRHVSRRYAFLRKRARLWIIAGADISVRRVRNDCARALRRTQRSQKFARHIFLSGQQPRTSARSRGNAMRVGAHEQRRDDVWSSRTNARDIHGEMMSLEAPSPWTVARGSIKNRHEVALGIAHQVGAG